VILQEFFPGIAEGEKRLWFIDGTLLSYAKKLPMQGDFRVDLDQGSQVVSCELTRAEKLAAQKIGRHLRKRKIRLAAVDLIEGKITDFNFTSPGMIVQMEKLSGENLAAKILKRLLL
jgi:glutathione synthase